MATKTSLDAKTSTPPPPSPASLQSSPQLASLPVSSVIDSKILEGPSKTSDDVMQSLQRQQARPGIPAPSLSPSRVDIDTSVADDLDAMLEDALKEFNGAPDIGAAAPASPAPRLTTDGPVGRLDLNELQMLLAEVTVLERYELFSSVFAGDNRDDGLAPIGERVNHCLRQFNQFFRELLQQEKSLSEWVEKENMSGGFLQCHPFAASYYLSVHLEKGPCLKPHLNQVLIEEWRQLYPRCVLLLKQNGLDAHNETEFPFDEESKAGMERAEMLSQNPQLLQQIAEMFANPEVLQQNLGSMQEMLSQNPQLLQQITEMFANPEVLQQNLGSMQERILEPPLLFFKALDVQLKAHPNDHEATAGWLRSEVSKAGYNHYFYTYNEIMTNPMWAQMPAEQVHPSLRELKALFESCCRQLTALGLESYIKEGPSTKILEQEKLILLSQKEPILEQIEGCILIFNVLSQALESTSTPPEAKDLTLIESRWQEIHQIMPSPFFIAGQLHNKLPVLKEVFDATLLDEFSSLYTSCRDQLLALGLEKYVNETPSMESLFKGQLAAAPKKEVSDSERFKKESEFFRLLLQQDEKKVDQWLDEYSPEFDYPLLWGKKRISHFGDYRERVNGEIRREWRMRFDACLEKLDTPALRHHLNTEQIPDDASPVLHAFLTA